MISKSSTFTDKTGIPIFPAIQLLKPDFWSISFKTDTNVDLPFVPVTAIIFFLIPRLFNSWWKTSISPTIFILFFIDSLTIKELAPKFNAMPGEDINKSIFSHGHFLGSLNS